MRLTTETQNKPGDATDIDGVQSQQTPLASRVNRIVCTERMVKPLSGNYEVVVFGLGKAVGLHQRPLFGGAQHDDAR